MLVEISCEKFQEKVIPFHPGLNIVLGDEKAANSIGKSTLLMIIDFCFGGNSLLEHNSDIVDELGHHEYVFKFKFKKEHSFIRGTENPNVVVDLSSEDKVALDIKDFRAFLKKAYNIEQDDLSFRESVSLFSRVWGKDNYDVKQPLAIVKRESPKTGIYRLIKLFDLYSSFKEEIEDYKSKFEEKSALLKAQKKNLIPSINKTQMKANLKQIEEDQSELDDIKKELSRYAVSITEIKNKEIYELKAEKDELLKNKLTKEIRLKRIKENIAGTRKISSKSFESLKEYVPNINEERIQKVEEFHSNISNILKKEFQKAEKELTERLMALDDGISTLDEKISKVLDNPSTPNDIIERVVDVSRKITNLETQNYYYSEKDSLTQSVKELAETLDQKKKESLELMCTEVNDQVSSFVRKMYEEGRKSPVLEVVKNNYSYKVKGDTGTGKAFSNLVVFDLSIFSLSNLPILIHDSFLFKNIENKAVEESLEIYNSFSKQSFIALDEHEKFANTTQKLLKKKSVVKLSANKLLYVKDWRSSKK